VDIQGARAQSRRMCLTDLAHILARELLVDLAMALPGDDLDVRVGGDVAGEELVRGP